MLLLLPAVHSSTEIFKIEILNNRVLESKQANKQINNPVPFIVDKTVLTALLLSEVTAVHGTGNCILLNSSFFNVSLNSKMGREKKGEEMTDFGKFLGNVGCKWGLFSPDTRSPN